MVSGTFDELRREYSGGQLDESDLAPDWPTQFGRWLAETITAGLPEPNAMVLATADGSGQPSSRTVLLKDYDERGFVFFTNYQSRKGTDLTANPYASLVFPWFPIFRQVIVMGPVERTSRAETEAYFATRPRGAQVGAWASPQSHPLPGRPALEEAWQATQERFGADEVPAPPHWGGYRVLPISVEFWQGRVSRLHDRLRYRRDENGQWLVERLAP
ncbi:pyridoxamine 5'-phosphate oxidase [Rugosimonospora acidiphila]|uniref:Pyridoxine/pyridoxamine 5'-phosphate oxidase n=1 Tax=Rugosimonospora acidiphila TaxID=556531 RepID=A0ABP9SL92_9ACTN